MQRIGWSRKMEENGIGKSLKRLRWSKSLKRNGWSMRLENVG